jgi:hypothetical protein
VVRTSYASLCLGLRISSYLVHSVVCTPQSFGKLKKTREEATAFLLLPPPGKSDVTQPSRFKIEGPARPSGTVPESLGTARFAKPLEMKKRAQERPLPASGGAGAAPPPKTTAPASWRLTLPWVSPEAGWWVTGATGRANCAC